MRLIDADKITFFNCLAKTGNTVCCHAEGIVSKSAIEMQQTVKAIPIEWIKKWLGKLKNVYDDSVYQMLEDWEKENEGSVRN